MQPEYVCQWFPLQDVGVNIQLIACKREHFFVAVGHRNPGGKRLLTGRLNSAQPTAGSGFELDAIAAVVVGGTSLFGGRGGVLGSFLGAAIIGVLNNGMNLLGFNTFIQRVALGLLLIAAVAVSQWRQARAERVRTAVAAEG